MIDLLNWIGAKNNLIHFIDVSLSEACMQSPQIRIKEILVIMSNKCKKSEAIIKKNEGNSTLVKFYSFSLIKLTFSSCVDFARLNYLK